MVGKKEKVNKWWSKTNEEVQAEIEEEERNKDWFMKCKKCENNWDYLKDGELEVCYGCVGDMYMDGDGVVKDENKAIEYYLKGNEHGDTHSRDSLAWIYYSNENDEQFIKYAESGQENG